MGILYATAELMSTARSYVDVDRRDPEEHVYHSTLPQRPIISVFLDAIKRGPCYRYITYATDID